MNWEIIREHPLPLPPPVKEIRVNFSPKELTILIDFIAEHPKTLQPGILGIFNSLSEAYAAAIGWHQPY